MSFSADPDEPVRSSVADLLRGYSVGITIRRRLAVERCREFLPPGTAVYIDAIIGDELRKTVELVRGLQGAGFVAVPHVAARTFSGATALDAYLGDLAQAGVDRALVVGGDSDHAEGPFESGLDLLWTGLFQKHRITRLGLPWHLEGHPILSEADTKAALLQKVRYIKDNGLHGWLVSQFCFAASSYAARARQARAMGIDLPLIAGIAGPCGRETLIRCATRCRTGHSIRLLSSHIHQTERLVDPGAPDQLLAEIAAMQRDHAAHFAGVHLYSFGGIRVTAEWARAQLAPAD